MSEGGSVADTGRYKQVKFFVSIFALSGAPLIAVALVLYGASVDSVPISLAGGFVLLLCLAWAIYLQMMIGPVSTIR